MNTLVEHGIFQELSQYRAHVCFGEMYAYVFPTEPVKLLCATGKYDLKPAGQQGVEGATAEGYPVPVADIPQCRRIAIPGTWHESLRKRVKQADSTSLRGAWAVKVIRKMLREGLIPLAFNAAEVDDAQMQIDGLDIIVDCKIRIQVKCDWRGGKCGTGNLYIQTAERNPLRRI